MTKESVSQNSFAKKNQATSDSLSSFRGQFIFTAEDINVPEGWDRRDYQDWKLFTNDLPIIEVYDGSNAWLGWCIGRPVVDGIFCPENIVLKAPVNEFDPYEDFYNRTTGKWALLLVNASPQRIYLDPHGSLPTVFSTDKKIVASTPTLIGSDADWDEQLMAELDFPSRTHWLPSGLTFKKNVRRLLANHSLSLSDWKVLRHWPAPWTDLSIDPDTKSAVSRITENIQRTIAAVSKKVPLCLTITAGMDSRVVLACARDQIAKTKVITFANPHAKVDLVIAERLTKLLKLNHEFLPILTSSEQELDRWQHITGRSVAGDIWTISKTLTQLDPARVLMSGQSGEVHRGNFWRDGDTFDCKITATELVKRFKLPLHPVLIKATEEWLAETTYLNTFNMLDLVHIEQRMSCWGAIQGYGNTTSAFELSPLGSRTVFQNMMRLPHKYRKKQQLPYDICRKAWPELLTFPFNEYPGIYGYFRGKVRKLKKKVKRMMDK